MPDERPDLGPLKRAGADTRPILFLGCVPYRALRQRPQQLARALSQHTRLVYVEPHRSVLGRLASRETILEGPAEAGGTLEVLDPPTALPLTGYARGLNRLSYARTAARIRAHFRAKGYDGPRVIVASFPKHLDLVRRFPGVPVCYDVMDDYPLFFDRWQGRILAGLHRELLVRAEAVVVTSTALETRCRPIVTGILARVPNGVDSAFHEACGGADPDPAILALPGPRIGYAGALERWLDFDIVRSLAEAFPHGSVVLIGPSEGRAGRLRRDGKQLALPANVHWLGPKPHATLPAMLRALDVGTVPFRRSEMTEAVNAVKVYEYLSAGLPVLSADLDRARELEDFVTICRTPEEWRAAAIRALAGLREASDNAGITEEETAQGPLGEAARQRLALQGEVDPEARHLLATAGGLTGSGVRSDARDVARRREFAGRNLWSDRARAFLEIFERLEGPRA